MVRRAARLPVVALAAALAGCGDAGPKLSPVAGKVLVGDAPAEHATVVFHPVGGAGPDAVKPRGTVRADGTYALTTHTAGDGAPPGEYRVTVEWWLSGAKKASDPDTPPKNRLPAKYADPARSGLTATVGDGPTEVPAFNLKK
jgi:predicted small lipoprotein YifL